ncbi:MAG TPA: hypothetical protein PK816_05515, partial [Candidatus Cloacimonadota bacterium]|nr:hypothetical protein [Candidatus Cloacimonadota bacterium]
MTSVIDGFCKAEVKSFGPVQLNVPSVTSGVVRFSVVPAQRGPLFDAVGVAGMELITTVVDPGKLVQPSIVT